MKHVTIFTGEKRRDVVNESTEDTKVQKGKYNFHHKKDLLVDESDIWY